MWQSGVSPAGALAISVVHCDWRSGRFSVLQSIGMFRADGLTCATTPGELVTMIALPVES